MCCNGTLYNYVTLEPDDLLRLQKYRQLKLKVRNEQETFDEPCVLHTGTGCSAYEDRPATCVRYSCGVLRAVAREELTDEQALLLIAEGKALVENVKEYVTFEPGMPMAVSTWDLPPEGIEEAARLAWVRAQYHLSKYFLGTLPPEAKELPGETPPGEVKAPGVKASSTAAASPGSPRTPPGSAKPPGRTALTR